MGPICGVISVNSSPHLTHSGTNLPQSEYTSFSTAPVPHRRTTLVASWLGGFGSSTVPNRNRNGTHAQPQTRTARCPPPAAAAAPQASTRFGANAYQSDQTCWTAISLNPASVKSYATRRAKLKFLWRGTMHLHTPFGQSTKRVRESLRALKFRCVVGRPHCNASLHIEC